MRPAEPPLLVLRADAGSAIGTGHAMRLLALAQAWLDDGGAALWLVAEAPDWLATRFEREGIEVDRIAAAHPDPGDSAAVLARLAADPGARAAVDGLHVDEAYLDALAPVSDRLLAVDDMANLARYPVAIVLNQNAHADRASYPEGDARYLLGLDYTLLRREFRGDPPTRTIPPRARRLLVTFGGADPTGMAYRTIEALGELGEAGRDLEVVAVAGAANPAAEAIEAAAARSAVPVTLERSVEDMASRMTWADLAVVSAGSTVWELARTGCPALVVETAPAEAHLARGLVTVGLFDRLGPEAALTATALAAAIARRLDDQAWRAEMARLGPSLVDGRGASRVAAALREIDR